MRHSRTAIWMLLVALNSAEVGLAAAKTFNVRDYGARGDCVANDQRALQAAMNACAQAGGGTVRVPPGDYLSGPLSFGSDVTLFLEAGATLWVSTNRQDYGIQGSAGHFLQAEGVERIALAGQGTIEGQGSADFGARWGGLRLRPSGSASCGFAIAARWRCVA